MLPYAILVTYRRGSDWGYQGVGLRRSRAARVWRRQVPLDHVLNYTTLIHFIYYFMHVPQFVNPKDLPSLISHSLYLGLHMGILVMLSCSNPHMRQ